MASNQGYSFTFADYADLAAFRGLGCFFDFLRGFELNVSTGLPGSLIRGDSGAPEVVSVGIPKAFLMEGLLRSEDCTREMRLLADQYMNTAAGRSMVKGTINTATPLMMFLNRDRIFSGCPCMPSAALSSIMSKNDPEAIKGKA